MFVFTQSARNARCPRKGAHFKFRLHAVKTSQGANFKPSTKILKIELPV